MQEKYKTVAALNKAWGSHYTSFDSDGGWGTGTGLLDENGSHPWVGDDSGKLSKATAGVRADLDEFLYRFAKQYFSATATVIRKYAPGRLVFGPASLNTWSGLTRGPILKAAGEYVDVLQASAATQEILDLTVKYAGDIPIVTWTGISANADSALAGVAKPDAIATQKDRGIAYAQSIMADFDRQSKGTHPIVGTKFWAFTDSWGERKNWGLVTFRDNAYDGKEAVAAPAKDPWGFSTGGEQKDYGDFISYVREANGRVLSRLAAELASGQTSEARAAKEQQHAP